MDKFVPTLQQRDNIALRHLLVDYVTEAVTWLRNLSVEFFGPVEEPQHRLPRTHNVLPTSGSYVKHLTRAARRVRGPYAAGSTGQGGLLLEGHGHNLCSAFTSGRIAGRYAAQASAHSSSTITTS